MLKSPVLQKSSLDQIFSKIGMGGDPIKIEEGVFVIKNFNFEDYIQNNNNEYFDFSDKESNTYLSPYGVCDDLQQIKEKYSIWLSNPVLNFCISLTKIVKSEQSSEGGWRWHKWGQYIGDKNPQCEYIYDEDESIEFVYVYHIYQLLN